MRVTNVSASPSDVSYLPAAGVVLAGLGDYDPDMLDHEDEVGNCVVQYAYPSGEPAFVEVWGVSPDLSSFPLTIEVDGYSITIPPPLPAPVA